MENNAKVLSVPVAIIVAGVIVAGAIIFSSGGSKTDTTANAIDSTAPVENPTFESLGISPVNEDDHILGNPNAPIVFLEYSDTECPACHFLHDQMNRIIEDYGPDGDVAWVYRHSPLTQLHKKAQIEAEATECARELGGNDGFWTFTNRMFELHGGNDALDLNLLPDIAEFANLDVAAFNECLESERYAGAVQADLDEAIASAPNGRLGTPHTFFIVDGEIVPLAGTELAGALDYTTLKNLIDGMIENL